MILDYSLAGLGAAGLLVYLVHALGYMMMTAIGWAQIIVDCAIIVAITPVLGGYMTRVFNGERTFLSPILRPVEIADLQTCRRQRAP